MLARLESYVTATLRQGELTTLTTNVYNCTSKMFDQYSWKLMYLNSCVDNDRYVVLSSQLILYCIMKRVFGNVPCSKWVMLAGCISLMYLRKCSVPTVNVFELWLKNLLEFDNWIKI